MLARQQSPPRNYLPATDDMQESITICGRYHSLMFLVSLSNLINVENFGKKILFGTFCGLVLRVMWKNSRANVAIPRLVHSLEEQHKEFREVSSSLLLSSAVTELALRRTSLPQTVEEAGADHVRVGQNNFDDRSA